jgi:hypothetical protein
MFVGKSKANSSRAALRHFLLGWLMALPKSIILGGKGLLGTNTLAYWKAIKKMVLNIGP